MNGNKQSKEINESKKKIDDRVTCEIEELKVLAKVASEINEMKMEEESISNGIEELNGNDLKSIDKDLTSPDISILNSENGVEKDNLV